MSDASTLLETDRLRLRAFRHDDLDALGRMYADPAVTRYVCAPLEPLQAYRMAAGALAFLRRHADPTQPGLWAIERRADGVLMGRVGLSAWHDPDGHRDRWELGYLLGSPYWGHGFATEAARAVRDHARDHLDLGALVALVHPDNVPSHRVLAKLGFAAEPGRRVEEMGQPRMVWSWPG
jgi:RimJ/RimL family protein N-acetyltransferase